MNFFFKMFMACAIGVLASLSLATAGAAASHTQGAWLDQTNSKVRLVGTQIPMAGTSSFYAGLQLHMDKGWKTYWRNPGDSGVPPSFNWSGSKNVKAVEILYPAPHRFSDAAGTAIGYSGEVTFPLLITPERASEPVRLSLKFDYGLCKDLCIPNAVQLEAEFEPVSAEGNRKAPASGAKYGDGEPLRSALALVPKEAGDPALPKLTKISGALDGDEPTLEIEVAFPHGATGTDVFVDNPKAIVPVPKALGPLEDGTQRFTIVFPVREEAKALKGKPLTITLVAEEGSAETIWTAP